MPHNGQTVPRDRNNVPGLVGTDSTDSTKTVAVKADAITGRLLISATVSKLLGTTTNSTNVSTSTTVATLLALNTSRIKATIYNDSTTGILFVKEGATATATSFDYALTPATDTSPGGIVVIDDYSGVITGILSAGSGTARVGETTP